MTNITLLAIDALHMKRKWKSLNIQMHKLPGPIHFSHVSSFEQGLMSLERIYFDDYVSVVVVDN